jgi:hypothetical protein
MNQLEKESIFKAIIAQEIAIITKAGTNLSTFNVCSNVMAK